MNSREYERLAQDIYQCLLQSEGIQNIEVQHNVQLTGRSGQSHQIDVYLEFAVAGILHRIAIECKNWSKPVPVGKVRDFLGVLHDLGDVRGIMVSREGFQSGAQEYADSYKIELREVREPTGVDLQGRIISIEIQVVMLPVSITKMFVEADRAWMEERKLIEPTTHPKDAATRVEGQNAEIYVYDSAGTAITNFRDLETDLPRPLHAIADQFHKYEYEDAYLDSKWGRVKIKNIQFWYDVQEVTQTVMYEATELVKAIIKDVKTGEVRFIRKDGKVI